MKRFRDFVGEDVYDLVPKELERHLKRALHGKQYAAALKRFVSAVKDDPKGHDKRDLAAKIARQHKNVETRPFIKYVSDLAKKGSIPKELQIEEGGRDDDKEV